MIKYICIETVELYIGMGYGNNDTGYYHFNEGDIVYLDSPGDSFIDIYSLDNSDEKKDRGILIRNEMKFFQEYREHIINQILTDD